MRNFALSDAAASELWSALNNSTGASQAAVPVAAPAPPAPAPAAPVAIIPPPGAPSPSANQAFPIDYVTRKWYTVMGMLDSAGHLANGYVFDAQPDAPQAAPIIVDPTSGDGLKAVLVAVGGPAGMDITKVKASLMEGGIEAYNHAINFASQADPLWNTAVTYLIRGFLPTQALAAIQPGQGGITGKSEYATEAALEAAVPVIASFR